MCPSYIYKIWGTINRHSALNPNTRKCRVERRFVILTRLPLVTDSTPYINQRLQQCIADEMICHNNFDFCHFKTVYASGKQPFPSSLFIFPCGSSLWFCSTVHFAPPLRHGIKNQPEQFVSGLINYTACAKLIYLQIQYSYHNVLNDPRGHFFPFLGVPHNFHIC